MAVIHKLSTQVLGGRDSNTYLGNKGDIVLDPTSMTFYYHDGSNRGGTPIIGSGGSAVFQQLALVGNQLSITGGNTVDLTAVGFSGDYNDLANAPIIPADRPDQTLTLTGSTLSISNGNSIELGSMLFSGSYDDLTNKPTIPVDQTLTLSGNTVTISGSWSAIDLTPILGSGGTSLPNGDLFATLSWNGADWVSSIPTAQYIYSGTSDADAETLMNLASGGGYPSGPNPAPQGTLYWNRLNQVVRIYTATGWQDLGGGGGSETLTTLSLTGTDLDYTDENGTLTTIDLSPFLPITETVTSLSLSTNILKYTDETGTDTDIDLSLYIDDTNLARLVSGTVAANGMATFTRDDTTTFDVDFSAVVGGSDTVLNSLTFDSTTSALAAGVSDGNSYSVDLSTLNQQAELDATQVGAGLLDDGSYVVPDGFVPAPTTRDQGNNGEGLIATPNQLTDNLGPDRFFPTDVGSTVTITSGTQAGTYTIVSFIDQNNVTVDGSGWTADFSIASYTVTAPAGAAARPGSNYLASTTSLAEADLALDAAIYAASNQYIDDLLDVDTTTTPPTNNQALTWDGTNWVPTTINGTVPGGQPYNQLFWDPFSAGWVAAPGAPYHGFTWRGYTDLATSDAAATNWYTTNGTLTANGDPFEPNAGPRYYNEDLNKLRMYDSVSKTWVTLGSNIDNIDDLGDVDTTTTPPTNNDVLAWDGTNWIPQAPAAGGGVDTFTNAAAMDANSLVTFTRNDGNTHTLDLATLDNRAAIGNTAPTTPVDGDLWYDELTSRTFVYVASATSWVDASPTTTDTDTFTNAAAIDANSLVTFTRSDGNTYTLDLASVGGGASAIDELSDVDTTTTAPANNDLLAWDGTNWTPQAPDFGLDAGTQFGQILWWSGGAWSTSPATTFDQHGFQFDGYTGTFVSRQYAHWFESSEMQGSGTNLTVPTDKSYFKVDASSNTQLTLEYGQHVNVLKRLMLEIEITGGASVTLPTNVIVADNTPSIITGDGKYMFEVFGRNGATNTYLKSWSDPTYSQVSSWKPLGTTIVSNNSMPVSPFGFSTVGEVFAGATEGTIVCREGTEYNSAIIPSAAVASFPATFPIHKGGSLLASVTFTSATDTIFDVTIGSADEVKIFYR